MNSSSAPEVVDSCRPATLEEPPPITETLEASPEPDAHRPLDDIPRAIATQAGPGQSPFATTRVRTGRPAVPSWEPVQDDLPPRRSAEPKKRGSVRDRVGLERRTKTAAREPARRTGHPSSDSKRDATAPTVDEVVWPSVKDILPNHGASLGPPPTVARARKSRQPLPTVPREPGQWMLPVWLAWPPVAVSVLILGLGCVRAVLDLGGGLLRGVGRDSASDEVRRVLPAQSRSRIGLSRPTADG